MRFLCCHLVASSVKLYLIFGTHRRSWTMEFTKHRFLSTPECEFAKSNENVAIFETIFFNSSKVWNTHKISLEIYKLPISLCLSNISKEITNTLTDIQKIRIIWIKRTNIAGKPPKKFRNISHPELEISLYWHNFIKEISQLTDWQTYQKFRMIWI